MFVFTLVDEYNLYTKTEKVTDKAIVVSTFQIYIRAIVLLSQLVISFSQANSSFCTFYDFEVVVVSKAPRCEVSVAHALAKTVYLG